MMRSCSRNFSRPDSLQAVEECYFDRKRGEELSTLGEGESIRVGGKGQGKFVTSTSFVIANSRPYNLD